MAERIVIAKLEVDEKGVVKSYKAAGTAAKKMGAKTSQAGKKMQQNMQQAAGGVEKNMGQMLRSMFALSTAATALFSISIFVRSIKEFAVEILKSAKGMDEISAAAILLKDEVSELILNLIDGSGILGGWVDHLINIVALVELLNDKAKGVREETTLINAAIKEAVNSLTFGMAIGFAAAADQFAEDFADRIKRIRMDIERIVIASDKWVSSQIKLKQFGPLPGIESFRSMGEASASAFFDPFLKGPPPAEIIEGSFPMGAPSTSLGDLFGIGEFRNSVLEAAEILEETIEDDMIPAVEKLAFTFGDMQSSAATAGSILGQVFAGGADNIRQQIAQVLGFVATLAASRVAVYMAAAAAASTGLGAVIEGGSPAQFVVSAALWKKVAIGAAFGAAFVGASAGGGGGPTGAASVNEFGQEAVGVSGRSSQSVTIVVEGSVIGTSPDKLARELEGLLRTARSDGA